MTSECNGKLLQAYRLAISEGHDGIADLLETVILELMGDANPSPIIIGGSKTTTEPPWRVTCNPLSVPWSYDVNATTECTGIDHLSKEVTS